MALVAATHWHSDHVRGIAQLFEASETAAFACSVALHSKEFLTLLTAEETDTFLKSPGLGELARVFRILAERRQSPRWAVTGRALWQDVLISLSPADAAVERAIRSFAALAPQLRELNDESRHPGATTSPLPCGWNPQAAVPYSARISRKPDDLTTVGVQSSPLRHSPRLRRASIYKVAHHGSANAHHDGIWQELLVEDAHAVVAPWALGRSVLPTEADIQRICSLSGEGHLTAPPRTPGRARARSPSRAAD